MENKWGGEKLCCGVFERLLCLLVGGGDCESETLGGGERGGRKRKWKEELGWRKRGKGPVGENHG